MWRMVCSHKVEQPLLQLIQQLPRVAVRPQRRIDLRIRIGNRMKGPVGSSTFTSCRHPPTQSSVIVR